MDISDRLVGLVIVIVILYAGVNALIKRKERATKLVTQKSETKIKNSQESLYSYILDVINNGSTGHNFPGGEMEGGYISKDDAKIVACYVLELTGRSCPHKYPKAKAEGFFSSVCAGCHGNDAKGINGTYPDLTKRDYVGFRE